MKQVEVCCNLCGRDEWLLRFPETRDTGEEPAVSAFRCTTATYGRHPQIVQCRYCGYVYANPRWDTDELLDAYQEVEDEVYVEERAGRELTFQKHLEAMEQVTGPAAGRRLLDVGAYIGVFVEVARAAGWNAEGIEPSRWAVEAARRRQVPVTEGTLALPWLANKKFDVITMWDVIEHLADPAGELVRTYRLLQPGGILAVHTMDVDSPVARLLGRRWPWFMDMHIHYFSRRTLRQMLQKQGFEIVWEGPQGRYLRMRYLASRLGGLYPLLGRAAGRLVDVLGVAGVAIPINLGDLFTVYARRPATPRATRRAG